MRKRKASPYNHYEVLFGRMYREAATTIDERRLEWAVAPDAMQYVVCDATYMDVPLLRLYPPFPYPYPPALKGVLHGVELFVDDRVPSGVVELRDRSGAVLATTRVETEETPLPQ